jgi:hypothetical protein
MQENEINNAKKELANLYLTLKLGKRKEVIHIYIISLFNWNRKWIMNKKKKK